MKKIKDMQGITQKSCEVEEKTLVQAFNSLLLNDRSTPIHLKLLLQALCHSANFKLKDMVGTSK